jgi:CRP/FNR family transcriptional regulator, cyclic AMP receptor protein
LHHDPEQSNDSMSEPIPAGFLATLPVTAAERLLADALRIDVPAGGTVYRDDERGRAIVVLHGLLRIYMSSSDGRQVTIRYARDGEIVGLALVIGGPAPITIQALTGASVVALRIDVLRAMLETDTAVARACAEELARQLIRAFDEIAGQAFLSVRQRVARQVLDLAVHAEDGALVAHVSQQELADAVASGREVVSRALHELQRAGLVSSARAGIVVSDPIGLSDEASGAAKLEPDSE